MIYHLLSTESDVTDIVADRIYPNRAPQGVSGDYIVHRQVDNNPTDIKGSVSPKDQIRWQVDGYCKHDDDRDALAAAIRKALDYKQGVIEGENIEQIRFSNSNGDLDEDAELFRTSQAYYIYKHRS